MGVDYSSTIGYGVTVEKIPDVISTDKYADEPDVLEWLDENGYSLLDFDSCGNYMSGQYIYLFSIKGTTQRVRPMYDEGVVSFDDPEVSADAQEQLSRLCETLDIPLSDVAWKLILNVS